MRKNDNTFASSAYSHVRSFFRSLDLHHRPTQWDETIWFWTGIQGAWSILQRINLDRDQQWYGPVATVDDLTSALVEQGVPQSAFGRSGAHTLLTLGNVSFVYRAKQYKNDGPHLCIAPHRTGERFNSCGHSFIHPFAPLSEFATMMLEFDRSIPAIQDACTEALIDARKESAERAIKDKIAATIVRDLFGEDIPNGVRFHVDGARHPSNLDIVRLEIPYTADSGWRGVRTLDIPLDFPRELLDKNLVDSLMDDGSTAPAYLELFTDDEYGDIPIIRYKYNGVF